MSAEPSLSLREQHEEPDSRPVPLGPAPVRARGDERPLPRAQRITPSAADITSERMLRAQAEPPPSGWRRALFQVTRGLVNPGPSAADRDRRELVARVKSPVAGCRRIAVVSRKGGVGKTTTTLMLGHTFASLRGDRVIALDGNPDAGSLAYRMRRRRATRSRGCWRIATRSTATPTSAPTPRRRRRGWRSSPPTTIRGSPTPSSSRTSTPPSSCWRFTTTSSVWTPGPACWSRRPRGSCSSPIRSSW